MKKGQEGRREKGEDGRWVSHICKLGLAELLARFPSLSLPYDAVLLLVFKLVDDLVVLKLELLIAVDKLGDHDLAILIGALELDIAGLEGIGLDIGHVDERQPVGDKNDGR